MIDTHAHLDFPQLSKDRDNILLRAKNVGISHILNIGANLATSQNSIQLASQYDFIFASVGVHPDDIEELENEENKQKLEHFIQQSKVKAIGEIGLDYFRLQKNDHITRENQKKYFIYQLQLAKKYNLPVIIHSRNAQQDTFEIIQQEHPDKVVLHCYAYDLAFAEKFLSLHENYMISFTGIITFPNATITKEVAQHIPLQRIMVETDCPFLAPQKYRGKTNEPCYVKEVIQEIATIKNISFDRVEKETDINAKRFFEI